MVSMILKEIEGQARLRGQGVIITSIDFSKAYDKSSVPIMIDKTMALIGSQNFKIGNVLLDLLPDLAVEARASGYHSGILDLLWGYVIFLSDLLEILHADLMIFDLFVLFEF